MAQMEASFELGEGELPGRWSHQENPPIGSWN